MLIHACLCTHGYIGICVCTKALFWYHPDRPAADMNFNTLVWECNSLLSGQWANTIRGNTSEAIPTAFYSMIYSCATIICTTHQHKETILSIRFFIISINPLLLRQAQINWNVWSGESSLCALELPTSWLRNWGCASDWHQSKHGGTTGVLVMTFFFFSSKNRRRVANFNCMQ